MLSGGKSQADHYHRIRLLSSTDEEMFVEEPAGAGKHEKIYEPKGL